VRRLALALVLVLGCTQRSEEKVEPKTPDAGPLAEPIELPWTGGLPLLTNVAPEPESYAKAVVKYRTATTAIAHGDLEGGTKALLETAKGMRLPDEHPHKKTYDAARCILYQNAAATWGAAKQPDVAKKRLTAIKAEDPACGASIDYALGRL
jgi:hypothetical protein